MITEKIYIENVTGENLTKTIDLNNPDSSFFFDVNLSALLDCLYYAGYNDDDILKLNNNLYGNFIRFYYLTDDDIYIMEIGTC